MSNQSVADFAGKSSQQYVSNSPETVDALKEEYMARDLGMSEEEALAKAQANMTATHSLSSFTSGEVPVDPPWPEALEALGYPADVDKLVFNAKNTTVTMSQAVGSGPDDSDAIRDEILKQAPTLLPHQVKGKKVPHLIGLLVPCGTRRHLYPMWDKKANVDYPHLANTCGPADVCIIIRYIQGRIGAYLNANSMGLGKSLIAELVAFALSLAAHKPGAKGPFGPHAFICQTELLMQYTTDCLRFFSGLRKYYIVSSTSIKAPRPDIKIIHGKKAWEDFQFMIWEKRDEPEVSAVACLSHMGQATHCALSRRRGDPADLTA